MVPSRSVLVSLFMRVMAVARYRFIVELTVVFIAVWCGCGLLIYYLEHDINTRIHHPMDAIYYLLVTMMTSGDSAVVPQTVMGRIVISGVLLASKLLTALLCALAAAVLIERKVKEEMGLKMHKLENHFVVIGWNLKGTQVIHALQREMNLDETPVLIMADAEQKPIDDPMVFFTRTSYPIRGEAMQRASLASAATIIVLANYAERQHADALTAINCLMARTVNSGARIIAELLDPSQRVYLEAAGANAIVGIGEVGGLLLAEVAVGKQEAQNLLDAVAPR